MGHVKKIKIFIPGKEIWVIERDEEGLAADYSGYMFLAISGNAVIVSSFIDDYDFDKTINYHVKRTAADYDTPLSVFPIEDCFADKDECEAVYKKLLEDNIN